MTDCSNVEMRELLPDLLHDRLDAASRAVAQAHVAACEECAAELELLRRAQLAMRRAPAVDVARIVAALPPAHARAVADAPLLRVARGGAVTPVARPGRVPAWRRYAVAAALLLAAGVSGVTWLRPRGGVAGAGDGATVAGVAEPVRPLAAPASDDQLLAVNVEGLTNDDFAGLLNGLDDLDAIPASDPVPVVRVERDGAGGD